MFEVHFNPPIADSAHDSVSDHLALGMVNIQAERTYGFENFMKKEPTIFYVMSKKLKASKS